MSLAANGYNTPDRLENTLNNIGLALEELDTLLHAAHFIANERSPSVGDKDASCVHGLLFILSDYLAKTETLATLAQGELREIRKEAA